ncbi:hypothetical protein [Bacteroides sp. 519]|uniref:hypothetical protein n=1 Tax=Bacteroides sp. 519 TaxID=2302937 RepID=UPI0013D43313|nr:hypothetical protein [Bacteroides sp. 519]NDV60539.1 hypothetical protein [Bacteroides sp. 519]
MKYNKAYEGGDFESYITYLETIKHHLSDELFEFVSDPQRHGFGVESLHDSWVKKIEFTQDFDTGNTNLLIVLLGENCEFYLYFEEVQEYTIRQINSDMYRDLITYEIGFEQNSFEEDMLVFRAIFAIGEGHLEVFAETIRIEEKK